MKYFVFILTLVSFMFINPDLSFSKDATKEQNTLYNAVTKNQLSSIESYLKDKNHDIDLILDDDQNTMLTLAASIDSTRILEYLLDKGAAVDVKNSDGNTALHFATSREVTMLLLDYKADPNILNNDGYTPLMNCVIKGMSEKAKVLIEFGADLYITTSSPKDSRFAGMDALGMAHEIYDNANEQDKLTPRNKARKQILEALEKIKSHQK